MTELLKDINEKITALKTELETVESGVRNKAAAKRARKLTLELTKLFKDFRKESVKL